MKLREGENFCYITSGTSSRKKKRKSSKRLNKEEKSAYV